jgi:hypothetical protein
MMNMVMPFLMFTMEIGEDFVDLILPILDVKIWVANGIIEYDFFEKPRAAIMYSMPRLPRVRLQSLPL